MSSILNGHVFGKGLGLLVIHLLLSGTFGLTPGYAAPAGMPTEQFGLQWNTFMGATGTDDTGRAVAVDVNGNVYVAGESLDTWGSPVNAFVGSSDAFVAKFDNDGVLQWHTFIGAASDDSSRAIAVDANGNVYVTGAKQRTGGFAGEPFCRDE